ncbi:MAG: hypothetical protein ACK56F_15770 [bacterium]
MVRPPAAMAPLQPRTRSDMARRDKRVGLNRLNVGLRPPVRVRQSGQSEPFAPAQSARA